MNEKIIQFYSENKKSINPKTEQNKKPNKIKNIQTNETNIELFNDWTSLFQIRKLKL